VFDALQTRIRRGRFVVERIPVEIPPPFHIHIFVLFIGIAKKINDPFPLHGIRHTETRVPMNNYYPNFCRDYALLYHGYLISGNNYVDRSKHKSTFAYEFFSENISGPLISCSGWKKNSNDIYNLKKEMIILLTNRNITNEHVARSINHSRYRDHRFRFSISACFFFKHSRRDDERQGGKRGAAINSARAA